MFEGRTPEQIAQEILTNINKNEVSTAEGSFASDIIAATALEMSKVYHAMDTLFSVMFVTPNSGEYLIRRAAEFGIYPKAAQRAASFLTATGTAGTVITIPQYSKLTTDSGIEFWTARAVTLDGTNTGGVPPDAIIIIWATTPGAVDIPANSLRFEPAITGVTVTHPAIRAGTDAETNLQLYNRLMEKRRNPSASGSVSDYRRWAMECDGVGAARVEPLWNGAGTVRVVLASEQFGAVSQDVINTVTAYINRNKPVGATVTVVSGAAQALSISCAVIHDSTVPLSDIIAEFREKLQIYFNSITFRADILTKAAVSNVMLDCRGVKDVTDVTLAEGSTASYISIADKGILSAANATATEAATEGQHD